MAKLKNMDTFLPSLAQVIISLLILLFDQNLLWVLYKVLYGEAPLSGPAPYSFVHHSDRKGTPLRYTVPFIERGYPFHLST